MNFSIGEVCIFVRPESPYYGREVTVIEGLATRRRRDMRYSTDTPYVSECYVISAGVVSPNGEDRWTVNPEWLRKRGVKIAFSILGQPCSKANSRRLVTFGKRPAVIKSREALAYERVARLQIPSTAKQMLAVPVRVTIRIFYASERPDLDESLILDLLQPKYEGKGSHRRLVSPGVYVNDRLVRERHVYHGIDRANPRAEIEIEPIELQQQGLIA